MPLLMEIDGHAPTLGDEVFLAENATILGDVVLGQRASVWFGAVLRGDVGEIRIGAATNVQDLTVIHVHSDGHGVHVGERCTIGHRVALHGCTIGRLCLIGIGSVVMDRAEIGDETLVGAGSLVAPGAKIPGGVLALGSPARVVRDLTAEERQKLRTSADGYVALAARYRAAVLARSRAPAREST